MRNGIIAAAVGLAVIAALGPLDIIAAAQQPAQGRGGRGGGGRGGRGGGMIPPLLMKTDAFEDGGMIPERYAGRGGNVRPGFTFSNIPNGTVSFAIVLQDLDVAATGPDGVLHWLAWNIPANAGGIPEGSLPEGAVSGTAESAAEAILAPAHQPAPGTITTCSNFTR